MYLERLITLKANQGTAGKKCTFKSFLKIISLLKNRQPIKETNFLKEIKLKKLIQLLKDKANPTVATYY